MPRPFRRLGRNFERRVNNLTHKATGAIGSELEKVLHETIMNPEVKVRLVDVTEEVLFALFKRYGIALIITLFCGMLAQSLIIGIMLVMLFGRLP
jgi:hypothetical protein